MSMTAAPDRNWQSYSNDTEDDCVEVAIANVILAQTGHAPAANSVQKFYRSWIGRILGGMTGLRLWQFFCSGLDGYRAGCFGMIAKSEHRWAIDNFGGFIAGLSGGHEVAAVGYDSLCIQYVSLGQLQGMPWANWNAAVDRDCFAFSRKFDIRLPLKGMKNNWVWWVAAVFAVIVSLRLMAPHFP